PPPAAGPRLRNFKFSSGSCGPLSAVGDEMSRLPPRRCAEEVSEKQNATKRQTNRILSVAFMVYSRVELGRTIFHSFCRMVASRFTKLYKRRIRRKPLVRTGREHWQNLRLRWKS